MDEKNNEMPFMKYLIDGLPPEIVKKARKELGETEEHRTECLKELKSFIKDEPDLQACMEDAFLLRFLRAKKYKTMRAFKTLKNYYTYKASYSGIFTDFRPSDCRKILEMNQITALEYRDSSYVGIGVVRVGALDFRKFTPEELVSAVLVCAELGVNLPTTAVAGYSIILDFEGISFHTIKTFASPTLLYRIITCIQDVIPCRIKAYHITNQPYYFNIVLAVAKSFMTEKLANRLHIHGSDMKSLHKHVPQEILPEEFGGKQGPMSKYLKEYKKKLYSMEDHYIGINQFGYRGKTLKELQKDNPNAILT